MIDVVVADDQELMRDGLAVIIDRQEDMRIVGLAANGAEAIERVQQTRPDVLLLDVRMPTLDGIAATRALRTHGFERLAILMLTTFDLDEVVYEALRAGATGFVLKDTPRDQLLGAIRASVGGEAPLAPQITRRLIERFVAAPTPGSTPPAELEQLTEREQQVLLLLARGRTNTEIAGELFLSEPTVKTHVGAILRKLQLRDRTAAAIWAYEHGIIRPGTP
jgi:DNA-binding NarL/FixJ family response regulator